jgi:hypothetical protein
MMQLRLFPAVAVCCALGSWACSGGADRSTAPGQPTQVAGSASSSAASGAGTVRATSVASVPASVQPMLANLPPQMAARFAALSPADQQQMISLAASLPQETRDRLTALLVQMRAHSGAAAQNDAPEAVFKTSPAADGNSIIAGTGPLSVTFNLCKTSDVDADDMKYLYDYDGDGTFDRGRCREVHTYEAKKALVSVRYDTTVCVSDRQDEDGHEQCKSFQIQVARGGKGCRTVMVGGGALLSPAPLFETAFFDIEATQAVRTHASAGFQSATPALGSVAFAVDVFECPGAIGYAGSVDGPVAGVSDYVSEYQGTGYSADASGCITEGIGLASVPADVSWKTQVCDPGSF